MTIHYVTGRDFYERETGRFTLRKFWNESDGWVDYDRATPYPEPMTLGQPREVVLRVTVTNDGTRTVTDVADEEANT